MQTSRILQLFYEGFDDFKRTVSEKSGVKFETKYVSNIELMYAEADKGYKNGKKKK